MRSDLELLTAWRDGDQSAGDELIRKHFSSLCRFFRNKLGDQVEDLVQRTFLDCVESRDRVTDEGFRAYMFAIARNRLYDHLRRAYRTPQLVDLASHSVADLGTSPSSEAARNQQERILHQALREIPVAHQIALELAYWEGLSGREIAHVLGIEENTVRSRLARARDSLRDRVQRLAQEPELRNSTLQAFEARTSSAAML